MHSNNEAMYFYFVTELILFLSSSPSVLECVSLVPVASQSHCGHLGGWKQLERERERGMGKQKWECADESRNWKRIILLYSCT